MIIKLVPQGNRQDSLSLEVQADILTINGVAYDLSAIPDGSTLPNASEATGCEYIRGGIERIDGELHVTVLLPYDKMPQTQSVLFPEPIHVTQDGPITLPEVRHDD